MSNEFEQSIFDKFLQSTHALLRASGYHTRAALVSQYDIIMESALNFVIDEVVFTPSASPVRDRFITEIPLDERDVFVFNQWGLYLLNTEGAYDTNFREHTYPNDRYFVAKEAEEGQIFYNAKLSVIVNNMLVRVDVPTDIFYMDLDEEDRALHELSSFRYLHMPLVLAGTKDIRFRLDLPRKTDWMTSTTRLRLRLRGLLVRNIIDLT
jgi:hypothetical protein